MTPEARARQTIDTLLSQAGWLVCDMAQANIHGAVGVAIRVEIPVPSLAEQEAIAVEVDRRLTILRGVEAEVGANLKRAQKLRQSVLTRAFSGKADPHPSDQEQ